MKRLFYLDILRIMAIIAVVMLHVSAQRYFVSFPSFEWEVRMFFNSMVRWGVPIFVMISGALFLDPQKEVSLVKLYSKNLLRIFVAFFVWSTIYEFYVSGEKTNFSGFFLGILKGPVHLWFLKMIIGLYIAIPLLRTIVINRKLEIYFLCLAFVTTFLYRLICDSIGLFNVGLQTLVINMIKSLYLEIAVGFTGYFVLGHFINTYSLSLKSKQAMYLLGILSFLFVVVFTHYYSHFCGHPTVLFYDNLKPFTLFEALAIFLLVKDKFKIVSVSYHPVIVKLSNLCFGIYLIHLLFVWIFRDNITFDFSKWYSIVYIPLFSLFVLLISGLFSWILSKIPLINKFVV